MTGLLSKVKGNISKFNNFKHDFGKDYSMKEKAISCGYACLGGVALSSIPDAPFISSLAVIYSVYAIHALNVDSKFRNRLRVMNHSLRSGTFGPNEDDIVLEKIDGVYQRND